MSTKHLGETIDIHAGGSDLIFPHHENEIAQSEGACGCRFVKYWIHFGFLNIQNEKMSKSLGNFFTAREILKKFPPESIRLLFNQAHYRGPLNFTDELLENANKALEKFGNFLDNLDEGENSAAGSNNPSEKIDEYYKKFEEAMDDDFNSPKAVGIIFDFVRDINKIISENEDLSKEFFQNARKFLEDTAEGVLGIIDFGKDKDEGKSLEKDLIQLLIDIRWDAKQNKNFELADKIRDELNNLGIVLKDSKAGTTYKKVK
jgi:cysteinyl-tRNA synthetase